MNVISLCLLLLNPDAILMCLFDNPQLPSVVIGDTSTTDAPTRPGGFAAPEGRETGDGGYTGPRGLNFDTRGVTNWP
jgi:hypothetical protein